MNLESLSRELLRSRLELTTRRHFLRGCATGLGATWLALNGAGQGHAADDKAAAANPLAAKPPQFPAKAKRVIYLHMVGSPSQLDLFEYKPELAKHDGQACPAEFLEGKRFAFIKGVPKLLGPRFPFAQHGQSGTWISDRLPQFAKVVDDVCFLRTMQTDQFNHGPAELMVHTGQSRLGYPSAGSWVTWGLGSENENLPGYIVLLSGGRPPRVGKALWSGGFLPSVYQGVQCFAVGSPVLDAANPPGVSRDARRAMLDTLAQLNQQNYDDFHDPETLTRIEQYELAFRMQTSVPDVMDISKEPPAVHAMYGTQPGKESFANNCLLARRLAEQGVRFIQLFDWGWDSHGSKREESLNDGFVQKCREADQPIAALLTDLKQRGMLDDTLVIFSGEFGRTPMREVRTNDTASLIGRDHHIEAFTMWAAGGGLKRGFSFGETDPLGYSAVTPSVPLRDFHATVLHLLGLDHERLAVPYQGLQQKLTGVKHAKVVREILS